MYIYDSVKKEKVEFIPLKDNLVKIYLCGPTVYDYAHLGHAKSAISFDLLRRVLIANNYDVKFGRNFTDIDDKILKKMKDENKTLEEITNFYIDKYLDDMDALNVLRPDISIKATECIDDMIDFINDLLDKKFAYVIEGDGVYFDTSKDKDYLKISNRKDENTQARVISNDKKLDDKDFALWKFDENFYSAKFGAGRPGWHTECVVMIKKFLCSNNDDFCIDIHAGGIDLLFPHHENEASQFRTLYNKELAKYWMHNGFVQINNEKMSKSLGNGFLIKEALNLVGGEALRYYLQSTHYRSNFNFSSIDLLESKKRLDKIYRLKQRLYGNLASNADKGFKEKILNALNDDLNVSLAYSYIDEMINYANEFLDKNPKDKSFKSIIMANLDFIKEIFGILYTDEFEYFQFGVSEDEKIQIQELIDKRAIAKKDKNFALADEIRDKLKAQKINLLDLKDRTIWEKEFE